MAFAACRKIENDVTVIDGDDRRTDVTVTFGCKGTKAAIVDVAEEDKINSAQVFVFNQDGSWDANSVKETGTSVTISCGLGQKTVCVLVNAPEIPGGDEMTLDSLRSISVPLDSNKVGNFVMYGEVSKSLKAQEIIKVDVKRLVCKIVLKDIRRTFLIESEKDSIMSITGFCMKHIVGEVDYGLSARKPEFWYNDYTNVKITEPDNVMDLTTEYYLNPPLEIADSDTVSVDKVFYVYPNNPSVTEKRTLLSIETVYGNAGLTRYYPIYFSNNGQDFALEANNVYTLKMLSLNRPGGMYDDQDTIFYFFEVEPWEEGSQWDDTY